MPTYLSLHLDAIRRQDHDFFAVLGSVYRGSADACYISGYRNTLDEMTADEASQQKSRRCRMVELRELPPDHFVQAHLPTRMNDPTLPESRAARQFIALCLLGQAMWADLAQATGKDANEIVSGRRGGVSLVDLKTAMSQMLRGSTFT